MKSQYRLFKRNNGIYFIQNNATRKQESLRTRDKIAAQRIFNAKNEACRQPVINLQIARAYLVVSDPLVAKRTWQTAMEILIQAKHGTTLERWQTAIKDKAFNLIRYVPLIETQGEQLLEVLKKGTVSTNVHLRKIHNFCLDMNWLPWPIIPKRQWPAIQFKEKRAITREEHEAIINREKNLERKKFYELCWHLGGSQGDVASLRAEDVDWENQTISYFRKKTTVPVVLHLGDNALNTLKDLPGDGLLFPYLARVRAGDRATEFKQRCVGLGIHGVSLHSYRYAWAERAKACGYPERYAQVALGHGTKAWSRAYAKKAQVALPSLEGYEQKIVPLRNLSSGLNPSVQAK